MATPWGSRSPLPELHLGSSFQKSPVLLRWTWAKCQVWASREKSRKPGDLEKGGRGTPSATPGHAASYSSAVGWFQDPLRLEQDQENPGLRRAGLAPCAPQRWPATPHTRGHAVESQVLSSAVLFAREGALQKVLSAVTVGLEKRRQRVGRRPRCQPCFSFKTGSRLRGFCFLRSGLADRPLTEFCPERVSSSPTCLEPGSPLSLGSPSAAPPAPGSARWAGCALGWSEAGIALLPGGSGATPRALPSPRPPTTPARHYLHVLQVPLHSSAHAHGAAVPAPAAPGPAQRQG